jgi:metallo-beta-lactamase family protein
LYYLEEAFRNKEIFPVNVYVDSPMAIRVTDMFKDHTQCYNAEMQKRYDKSLPFQSSHLVYTKSVDESKALNDVEFPCVIISAS